MGGYHMLEWIILHVYKVFQWSSGKIIIPFDTLLSFKMDTWLLCIKDALNDISVVYLFLNSGVLQWNIYYHAYFGVIWTYSYRGILSQDKHDYQQGKRYYSEDRWIDG